MLKREIDPRVLQLINHSGYNAILKEYTEKMQAIDAGFELAVAPVQAAYIRAFKELELDHVATLAPYMEEKQNAMIAANHEFAEACKLLVPPLKPSREGDGGGATKASSE